MYGVKIENQKVWVPVFVQTYIHHLNIEELQVFHSHAINFNISSSKNKISEK